MENVEKISKNVVASLVFTVTEATTGKVVQQVDAPEEFLIGNDLLLDAFENGLAGLAPGDTFHFSVDAASAYGPIDPHAIFDLPMSTFAEADGKVDEEVVQVGHVFPMADKDGNRHYGKIIRKMKDSVTMDFNHPLAGKDLVFQGKVISLRMAHPDELKNL